MSCVVIVNHDGGLARGGFRWSGYCSGSKLESNDEYDSEDSEDPED